MKARLIIALLLTTTSVFSQTLVPLDSITVNSTQCVSIDRLNNIYLADKKGNVKKYNSQLKLISEYSPQKIGALTLVEAWNPLRIFLFYENFQEYQFLNRFLTSDNRFALNDITSFANMVTVSTDNNLWVIDQVDFGLKKYNINFGQYTIKTSFDLLLNRNDYEISFIKEYQNMVFIADKKSGVLVFDNLGNYLYTLPFKKIEYFNFSRNEIYFLNEGKLRYVNIYSRKPTQEITLPQKADFALQIEDRVCLIFEKVVKTFKISR